MVKVIDSTEEERKRESDRQAALGLVKDFVKYATPTGFANVWVCFFLPLKGNVIKLSLKGFNINSPR